MNRRVVIVFLSMLFLVVLLVIFTVTHQRPKVPADADHLKSDEIRVCLSCHGRGASHARSKNHPLNDQCWDCHERAR